MMTERVVDGLEAIEVDEEHAGWLAGSAADRERLVHAVEKERLVGQTGEIVVERLLDQALFGLTLLGDVAA